MQFQETEFPRVACADIEDQRNQVLCFHMDDFNAAFLSSGLRRTKCPSKTEGQVNVFIA